jgi:hypothetical protein
MLQFIERGLATVQVRWNNGRGTSLTVFEEQIGRPAAHRGRT